MTFEENFPILKERVNFASCEPNNSRVVPIDDIEEYCLSKQKAKKIIEEEFKDAISLQNQLLKRLGLWKKKMGNH